MTLSKIRKLKRKLLDIQIERDLEISTVACSYVYLEKLLLQNQCSKENLNTYGG